MNLTCIKVNGYKNLIDCELHLGNFNVLIGPNNSGKSNLLEIFWFLNVLLTGSDAFKKSLFEGSLPEIGPFGTMCEVENPNLLTIELEFTCEIESVTYRYWYCIELELINKAGHIKSEYFKYKNITSTGNPKTVFEREGNNIIKLVGQRILRIGLTEAVLSIVNKLEDIKLGMNTSAQKGIEAVYQICSTPILYYSPKDIRMSVSLGKDVVIGGRISALSLNEDIVKVLESEDKEFFKEILDDVLGIKDVQYIDMLVGTDNWKVVTIEFPDEKINQLFQLSDGTRIVLSIITYLFSKEHTIIAIEELENSLHPKLLKKIIRLIKDQFSHIQVIITTHSPALLNMVKVEDVSIITNKENGAVRIERAKDKKELVKKLNNDPFSSFGDIFYEEGE